MTNDLSNDQRVAKVCNTLFNAGYEILLIGRLLPLSYEMDRKYSTHRIKLFFNKSFLFYAEFNFRLFFFLIFKKVNVYHANDLDTLLPLWLLSKIKRKPIVYDSHEYFLGVPEIQNKPFVKWFWKSIEKRIFPKLKYVFTVNESIANLYYNDYKVKPLVLRNLPNKAPVTKVKSREDLGLPKEKKIVILQGAGINIDRGAEELLEAISIQDEFFLCIVGKGDVMESLKIRSKQKDLINKVIIVDTLPYNEMMQYTFNADAGLSLDKPSNLNYLYSLPNKLFDYFKSGLPVVSSDLVEIRKIINTYRVGVLFNDHIPESILNAIKEVFIHDDYLAYKKSTNKIIEDLNWEKESEILIKSYKEIG